MLLKKMPDGAMMGWQQTCWSFGLTFLLLQKIRTWTSVWAQVPRSREHRKHSWARLTPLATELGKLGFSHHSISSGPSSLAHMFSPFPRVLIIHLKTLLRIETQRHFEVSCAHCLMEFILCPIWLLALVNSAVTAEQGLSLTTWAITKPQGGFRLLLKAEELPQSGEHRCDHPPVNSTWNNFTK